MNKAKPKQRADKFALSYHPYQLILAKYINYSIRELNVKQSKICGPQSLTSEIFYLLLAD